jgi:amino acid transporter
LVEFELNPLMTGTTYLMRIEADTNWTLFAVVTVVHVAVLLFIIAAGAVKARPSNLEPFAPFGARGMFSGAAYVYFTYTGFDAVATSAEEVTPVCDTVT